MKKVEINTIHLKAIKGGKRKNDVREPYVSTSNVAKCMLSFFTKCG